MSTDQQDNRDVGVCKKEQRGGRTADLAWKTQERHPEQRKPHETLRRQNSSLSKERRVQQDGSEGGNSKSGDSNSNPFGKCE